MQNIIIEFNYTRALLKDLYRFTFLPKPKAKFFLVFVPIFLIVVSLIAVLGQEISEPTVVKLFDLISFFLKFLACVWAFWLFIMAFAIFYLPIYAFEKSPGFQGSFVVKLSDTDFAYTQLVWKMDLRKR